MARITDENLTYTSAQLRRLQAFENLGWEPNEITPKKGSVAAKSRHNVELAVKGRNGGTGRLYEIVVDGEKMTPTKFAKDFKININTVYKWINTGTFYDGLRSRGVIL